MATIPNSITAGQNGAGDQPQDPRMQARVAQAKNVTAVDTGTSNQGAPDPIASNASLEKDQPEVVRALRTISTMCAKQIIIARRMQIYRAGRAELYYLGKQKIFWNGGQGQWNGTGSNGGVVSAYDYECESFDFVTNFYKGYAESFMTTATENVPAVPFYPEDPNRREDLEAARNATSASELIARWNESPMMCSKLAYHGFNGGLMATYTREVTDGIQFGFEIDPATGQAMDVPKSRPVTTVLGALDVSVPMWADNQADMNYLCWFVDMPKSTTAATYPWLEGKIPSVSDMRDDDVLARLFRAAIRGNIAPVMPSDAMDDITTTLRIWLRPSTYWYIGEDEQLKEIDPATGAPMKLRDKLKQMYPRGVLVHWAGNKYAASVSESMDDGWAVECATEGRGMARPGIGESFIEVQDQINILSNLFHEYLVYGIPPIFHHAKALNKEAIKQMTAKVSQFLPVNLQDQIAAVTDMFWQPQAAVVPEALISRLDALAGAIGQFLTGIYPALQGAGVGGAAQETAKGYAMQLQQAMGRIAFFFRRLKSVYQRTMYIAVREFAANREKDMALSSGDPTKKPQKIDPLAIRAGNFNVYPEADEGFPVLGSSKRDSLEKLLEYAKEIPAFQEDLNEPANQMLIKNYFGLTDWVVAGELSRLKQLKEIDELMVTEPIPVPDPNSEDPTAQLKDPETGKPVEESSVPIQPLDHDELEFAEIQRWANDDAGMQALIEKPRGYQNVMLHADLHQKRIQSKAATAQPPAKVSINIPMDKMPQEAIAQELEKQGIHLQPQDFIVQHEAQKDLKTTAPPKDPATPKNGTNGGGKK
jgi:hypothetical protein